MLNMRDCEVCGRRFGGGVGAMCPLCQRSGKIEIFDKELKEPILKYGKIWALPLLFLWAGGQFGMELHAGNPVILPAFGLAIGGIIGIGLLFMQKNR